MHYSGKAASRYWASECIGIDISSTSCRVMVRRLKENFNLKERQGFRVIDLPKTIRRIKGIPCFYISKLGYQCSGWCSE